jgi:hypothetical protein
VKFTPVGRTPVFESAAVGFPVVITLKLPTAPTAKVALVPLVIEGGTSTVTDAVAVTVAGVVAEFVTVKV